MRYLPSIVILGFVGLTLRAQSPTPAGDPFVKNPASATPAKAKTGWQNCFVVLEVYALEKNDALGVIEGETGNGARYHRTRELASAGKARLETLTALSTKSGQRAVSESIDEVRYPTEFNPPADEKSIAAPSAWETRSAGDTLEIEPVLSADGQTCDVNLVPQHIRLTGLRDIPAGAGAAPVSQPIFDCQKLLTSASLPSGAPLFLGTYTPPPAGAAEAGPEEVWLAFLRVDAQVSAADPKPAPKSSHGGPLHIEYSIYSLDRAAALELLAAPSAVSDAWEKLQPLLGEKKARFEHLTTITASPGQRVQTEETREERYWTEMRPASRAGAVETTRRTTVAGPTTDPAQTAKDLSKSTTTTETTTVTRDDANSPRIPAYTTAFETRNAGVAVEIEPALSPDGQSVELNEIISQTKLLGNLPATGVAEKYPWQPLFEARKMTTTLTLPIGVHVLTGTLNPPGADGVNGRTDNGRTFLLFVRAVPSEP